jgi:hypothetical protein
MKTGTEKWAQCVQGEGEGEGRRSRGRYMNNGLAELNNLLQWLWGEEGMGGRGQWGQCGHCAV